MDWSGWPCACPGSCGIQARPGRARSRDPLRKASMFVLHLALWLDMRAMHNLDGSEAVSYRVNRSMCAHRHMHAREQVHGHVHDDLVLSGARESEKRGISQDSTDSKAFCCCLCSGRLCGLSPSLYILPLTRVFLPSFVQVFSFFLIHVHSFTISFLPPAFFRSLSNVVPVLFFLALSRSLLPTLLLSFSHVHAGQAWPRQTARAWPCHGSGTLSKPWERHIDSNKQTSIFRKARSELLLCVSRHSFAKASLLVGA